MYQCKFLTDFHLGISPAPSFPVSEDGHELLVVEAAIAFSVEDTDDCLDLEVRKVKKNFH